MCRDVASETDHCVWSLPHGAMSERDEQDEVCRLQRCSDLATVVTLDGDEPAACAAFLNNSCQFNPTANVCWETGQELPCEFKGAFEESMCPSPCVWNEENYNQQCSTPGSHAPCGQAYDSAGCTRNNPDCRWQAGSGSSDANGRDECGTCYNATRYGADVPCDDFYTKPQSCCPTARCRWTVVMEAPDDLPPDEGETGDGRCTAQTEDLACEQYQDEADCPRPRCEFFQNDNNGMCSPAGRAVPCDRLEPRICHEEITCLWVGAIPGDEDWGTCQTCPTSNCLQPYNGPGGPDDGAPCAQHGEKNCPTDGFPPRCAVYYPGDDGDDTGIDYNPWECAEAGGGDKPGMCGDPTCADSYAQDACLAISGCSWTADSFQCSSPAQGPACDRIFHPGACSGLCTWQPLPAGCGDDESGDYGICVSTANPEPPCTSFDVESAACCPQHCTWYAEALLCASPDYTRSCESYGSRITGTYACPTDRCAVNHGVCHAQGRTIGCKDICNKFICTASGDCHWNDEDDGDAAQCVDGAGALEVCSTLQTEAQCDSAEQCAYLGSSCVEGVCADIDSPEVCGAWSGEPHNCVYSEGHGCSYAFEELPCAEYYDNRTCPSDRCHYDQSCHLCMDTGESCPCHVFWSESECPSTGRCTWTGQSCELNTGDDTPPPLTGAGDHNISHCTSAMKTNLRPVLDAAVQDCVDESATPGPATTEQIKCLDYYVKHASSPTTLVAACPCLRWWAEHESPEMGYWMDLDC